MSLPYGVALWGIVGYLNPMRSSLTYPGLIDSGFTVKAQDFKCGACGSSTTQFITDDGEYYYPQCGECN